MLRARTGITSRPAFFAPEGRTGVTTLRESRRRSSTAFLAASSFFNCSSFFFSSAMVKTSKASRAGCKTSQYLPVAGAWGLAADDSFGCEPHERHVHLPEQLPPHPRQPARPSVKCDDLSFPSDASRNRGKQVQRTRRSLCCKPLRPSYLCRRLLCNRRPQLPWLTVFSSCIRR